ncbi:Variable outer membrane protein (plasmid) [Borrelia crocidurae DOU]|uniref:Variable large protein n=1 Tax=Borrelia crocidurae DOU TaxID=1293575 RepID=W5SJG8_9SPIR|nr:Variable outer membrane protein [Borrelia crocidurae DOU]
MVSGADILQAIAKSSEAVDNSKNIEEAKDAAGIAAAKKEDGKTEIKEGAKKDAVIAGGIALRGEGWQRMVNLRLRLKRNLFMQLMEQ